MAASGCPIGNLDSQNPAAAACIINCMGRVIAVDIGGTHMRAAVYDSNNPQPLAHERLDTRADLPGAYERLQGLVRSIWPKDGSVTAIGVASPGPLDPHLGVILKTPNIPEWRDFPLVPRLSADFGVPAFLDNDGNAAALGEWMFGAAKGHHDALYITVSTGIGAGVIVNDALMRGFHGLAAELGHVIIDPDGPPCNCGFHGHVESFSSGPAIVRYVLEQLGKGVASGLKPDQDLSARTIAEAAQQGDALAVAAYRRAGEYLGIAVASFLHAFDPSIVVFGGGVSLVGPLLFDPFHASLKQRVFHPRYLEGLKIEMGALGDDAGLLGALALAQISTQV
jgi:glucokinase